MGTLFTVLPPTQGTATYYVKTWGPDEKGVRAVLDGVLAAASAKAADIQKKAGAPEQSQYTTFVTAPSQVMPDAGAVGHEDDPGRGRHWSLGWRRTRPCRRPHDYRRGGCSRARLCPATTVTSDGTTRRAMRSAHRTRGSRLGRKSRGAEPELQRSGRATGGSEAQTTTSQSASTNGAANSRELKGTTTQLDPTQGRTDDAEGQFVLPASSETSKR